MEWPAHLLLVRGGGVSRNASNKKKAGEGRRNHKENKCEDLIKNQVFK